LYSMFCHSKPVSWNDIHTSNAFYTDLQLISSVRRVGSYDVVFLEFAGISSSGQAQGISTRHGLQHYTPPLRSLAVQSRQTHHYIRRLDLGEDCSARRSFLGIRTPETMLQNFLCQQTVLASVVETRLTG
jgi:hypothetical protein